jgi:hypothetical protein
VILLGQFDDQVEPLLDADRLGQRREDRASMLSDLSYRFASPPPAPAYRAGFLNSAFHRAENDRVPYPGAAAGAPAPSARSNPPRSLTGMITKPVNSVINVKPIPPRKAYVAGRAIGSPLRPRNPSPSWIRHAPR